MTMHEMMDLATLDRRSQFWRRRAQAKLCDHRAEAYEHAGRLLRLFGPEGKYPDLVSLLAALDASIRRLEEAAYLKRATDPQHAKACRAAARILRRVRWAAGRPA